MTSEKEDADQVQVNFESHPPIDSDQEAVANFLSKALLHYADPQSLARFIINLKDVTQVIAIAEPDEDDNGDEDEPEEDIFGVISVIELKKEIQDSPESKALAELTSFISKHLPVINDLYSTDEHTKIGYIINERYINLPPQLSLPTLKNLTNHLNNSSFTHLIFISKILVKSSSRGEKEPPTKKSKSTDLKEDDEATKYINAEEEIIFEHAKCHCDINVSTACEFTTFLGLKKDAKYMPFRRITLIDYKNWPKILECLDRELN